MDAADATTKRWGSKRSLRQLCSLHCVRWMKGNHALLGLLTSDRSAFCSINYSDVNSTFFKTIAALSYGARRAVAHPIFWLSENLLLVEKFSSKNATFDPLWENLEIKLKLWALKCLKSATFRQDQDQTIVFFVSEAPRLHQIGYANNVSRITYYGVKLLVFQSHQECQTWRLAQSTDSCNIFLWFTK